MTPRGLTTVQSLRCHTYLPRNPRRASVSEPPTLSTAYRAVAAMATPDDIVYASRKQRQLAHQAGLAAFDAPSEALAQDAAHFLRERSARMLPSINVHHGQYAMTCW